MQKNIFKLQTICLFILLLAHQKLLAQSKNSNEEDKQESYLRAEIGLGNGLYSPRNNPLKAKRNTNTLILSPSIGYFNKSGLSLSIGSYFLDDSHGWRNIQNALIAAYELPENKKMEFNFYYTHYFVNDKYSIFSSPIQNDFYSSFTYKKPWIEPAIALGYSAGSYAQNLYKDTTENGNKKTLYDSLSSKLNSFSMIWMLRHHFKWTESLTKGDKLEFCTSIMLNFGVNRTTALSNTNAPLSFKLIEKRFVRLQSNKFKAESIGLDLDATYTFSSFSIEPEMYFDYYIQQTNSNKLTVVYALTFAYEF